MITNGRKLRPVGRQFPETLKQGIATTHADGESSCPAGKCFFQKCYQTISTSKMILRRQERGNEAYQ